MDEPTSSLQRSDVQHLFRLIKKLKADGVSIIYISHFLEEVREIADTFTILRDGTIKDVKVKTGSGNSAVDRSAERAILNVGKVDPLPAAYERDEAIIEFWFELKR